MAFLSFSSIFCFSFSPFALYLYRFVMYKIKIFNMRKFLLFIFSLCAATTLFAQDVIITKDAKKINAKVTEIGVFVIKYKLAAETDGPTYVMPKSKIAAVTYASGRVETYVDGVTISSDSSAGGVTDSAAFVAATASSHDTVVSDTVSSYSQHAPVPP